MEPWGSPTLFYLASLLILSQYMIKDLNVLSFWLIVLSNHSDTWLLPSALGKPIIISFITVKCQALF